MPSFQPGQMIGHYKVVSLLGKGGMATVYKGYQVEMDRFVAVKVLEHQFATDPEFIGRFRQEARLIARLEHPHILPVYDFGESDGLPYFAMRNLEAGTLSDRLKAGPISLAEVDRIFTQFADALAYAHEKGVIHRDVKPSNAMLDEKGNLFLTDFGIAKLVEGTTHLTAAGAITGTPAYMSPEQAMGEKVGIQADIFSLGVVLYEMLTGSTPFTAETPLAIMLKMVNEPLPAPRSVNPQIHPALERVILKALSKDLGDRFGSMHEFLRAWKAALKEAAQNKTVAAAPAVQTPVSPAVKRPIPQGQQPVKTPVKRSKAAWLIILFIILIALIAALYFSGSLNYLLNLSPSQIASTQLPAKQTALPPKSAFLNSLILPKSNPGQWSFWADENNITSLAITGNYLTAVNPAGVTVWDLSDREHLSLNTQTGLFNAVSSSALFDTGQTLLLGTANGLFSIKDKNINPINSDSGMTDEQISVMAPTGENILIGTTDCKAEGSGLWLISGTNIQAVQGFPSSPNPMADKVSCKITAILAENSQNWWIGTQTGLAHFDGQAWHVYQSAQGITQGKILRLLRDSSGQLLAVKAEGLFSLSGDTFNQVLKTGDIGLMGIEDLIQDKTGNYWFAGMGGLVRYDPQTHTIELYNKDKVQIASNNLTSAAMDSNGVLYFGSDHGVMVTKDGYSFETLVLTGTLANSSFDRILSAPDGSTWFVNKSSTLVDQYLPGDDAWSSFPSHGSCCLIPLGFYSDGTLFGGGDTGAWFILGDTTIHLTTREGLQSNKVNAITLYGNRKVLIGMDNGMQNLNGDQIIGTLIPTKYGLPLDDITALYVAPDQSTWVGLKGGMMHITADNSIESYFAPNIFSNNLQQITGFATSLDGHLWVTTIGDGIYSLDNGNWIQYSAANTTQFSTNKINSVSVATNGDLWFGTEGFGAIKFSGGQWVKVDRSSGLLLDSVLDIQIDAAGRVWFAGDDGINRFSP